MFSDSIRVKKNEKHTHSNSSLLNAYIVYSIMDTVLLWFIFVLYHELQM